MIRPALLERFLEMLDRIPSELLLSALELSAENTPELAARARRLARSRARRLARLESSRTLSRLATRYL